jgi:hypothetical protein
MMRWARALVPKLCGRCGHPIAKGAPLLLIGVGLTARIEKIRGVCCAGPAPPDLPEHIERQPAPPPDLTRLGVLPLDWSKRED